MDVEEAARALAATIKAPRMVSVSAWHERDTPDILVWYDARYEAAVSNLPQAFEGYRIIIEPMRRFYSR